MAPLADAVGITRYMSPIHKSRLQDMGVGGQGALPDRIAMLARLAVMEAQLFQRLREDVFASRHGDSVISTCSLASSSFKAFPVTGQLSFLGQLYKVHSTSCSRKAGRKASLLASTPLSMRKLYLTSEPAPPIPLSFPIAHRQHHCRHQSLLSAIPSHIHNTVDRSNGHHIRNPSWLPRRPSASLPRANSQKQCHSFRAEADIPVRCREPSQHRGTTGRKR